MKKRKFRITNEEHFWQTVNIKKNRYDCWVWPGTINGDGYGICLYQDKIRKTHRVAFHLAVNPILHDRKMTIDHLCSNRICCNPFHLEAMPQSINKYREGLVTRTKRVWQLLYDYHPLDFWNLIDRYLNKAIKPVYRYDPKLTYKLPNYNWHLEGFQGVKVLEPTQENNPS